MRYKSKQTASRVDMTPMLDIVFIMLIFFIVTATFLKETGVTVQRPEGIAKAPDKEQQALVFHVEADNRLSLNGRNIDIWSAEALVKEAITIDPETAVTINLKEGADMKTFMRIYDGLRKVGVPKYRLPVLTHS
ncbi:biopolymer transporter ExbD [Kordiimonas sp. SCSIO 12603]|uniref:ExbD/TolR family protein n=1 Tax=Kordiimonas sp. SCSIO 12603 TaxID=2829596 RepID=UPI002103D8ED|nr:biopolymer transporter ExbD [Kordiimonas sp. SCSIO 12603]UTW58462.1 biopolymer transporter ExbD [Kordiimonas sp. SCSIO 12603]